MIGDNNNKKVEEALIFLDKGQKYQQNPISFMEKEVNGITRFAILKTTENGKYMRGNMLFYSLNGVSIYTESTNVIFVNTETNTMFIRDHEKVVNEINPSNPEERQYIMLYTDLGWEDSEEEFPLRWESVTGRTEAYENIKANAAVIDIDKSIVLVETVALKDSLSVRDFMNYIKNGNIIDDESFDINDYSSEYI